MDFPEVRQYEYGIRFRPDGQIHRSGFEAEEEALDWLAGWLEMGGSPKVFEVVKRKIGEWESV